MFALARTSYAQTQLFVSYGSGTPGYVGWSVDTAGDINADGKDDVIIGDLGYPVLERGFAVVFSGANGAHVYSLQGRATGDEFGYSVASAGDVNNDGRPDFIVGSNPSGYGNDKGYARVFSGLNAATLYHFEHYVDGDSYGSTVAGAGDVDADGYDDVMISGRWLGFLEVRSGRTGQILHGPNLDSSGMNAAFGAQVDGIGDVDHDGHADFLVASVSGAVRVFSGINGATLYTLVSGIANDDYGKSARGCGDVNADGTNDIAIGAPQHSGVGAATGRVYLYSGVDGALLRTIDGKVVGGYFGASVDGAGDVDHDGFDDIVVGAPRASITLTAQVRSISVFSGRTGERMFKITHNTKEGFGFAVAGAGDCNADGFADVLVGAPEGLAGHAFVFSPCPLPPIVYCTAKTNSLGCVPQIGASGSPSVSSSQPLLLTASQVINNKTGTLFYGVNGRVSFPFQGGFNCVAAPRQRTLYQSSAGNSPPDDCSGAFNFDFKARIQSGVDPALVVGAHVDAQYWSRDPSSASTTNLTDAVEIVICPR